MDRPSSLYLYAERRKPYRAADLEYAYRAVQRGEPVPDGALAGRVLAYQSSGEFLREDPHYHCIVLEGGFDERGEFVHIPLGDSRRRSEHFRRVVINAHLATSLINWKHSGFLDQSPRSAPLSTSPDPLYP